MGLEALKKMQEDLARTEETTGRAGAIPRTPKQMLLDAREIEEKDPEHHYRFVQTGDAQKAQGRILEGYRLVPEKDGGRSIGGLALMRIPRKKVEERIQRQNELSARRLTEHNVEMERLAEGMSKELRDRHGINVPPERLLVKE